MAFDVVIRGGTVVDGTGAPGRAADVGIEGGRIAAIGDLSAAQAPSIDAAGKVVAPGFVDVHTHYDAQVFWDGALTPSPLHGVTTVLAGNCGFTIAPLPPASDGDGAAYLMRMLARVEGMPLESLQQGVPWDWGSTEEYLDAVAPRLGVNAGFMAGHSAIRRTVMGPDAVKRAATPDELEQMKALLHAALDAGAIGFSSSWARTHNDPDGNMVPSRYAERDELLALAAVAGEHEGTSLEFIPMVPSTHWEDWAVELMADLSVAAQRPLNWNVLAVNAANRDTSLGKLGAGDVAAARGGKVVGLTVPMGFGVRLSLRSGFVLDAMPEWEHAMLLPFDEKVALLRDPEARRRLNENAQSEQNMLRMLAKWETKVVFDVANPDLQPYVGRTIGEIAEEQGKDPWDALVDLSLEDDLNLSFGSPDPVETDDDWKARVEAWRHPHAVIGASDAGAHLDLLASFNYTTRMLGEAVRARGLLPVEEAVQLLTDVPARLYGLKERGRLVEGWHADVVVFDPTTIASHDVRMRYDLPGGPGRLYAEADGIEHVLVGGTAIVRDGALTDARTGTLVRSGQDTATPELV